MKPRLLSKKSFSRFIAGLAADARLFAPVRIAAQDGEAIVTRFGPVAEAAEICFDGLNTRLPVKELFLPQREVLFSFRSGEMAGAEPVSETPERVVFGVRPCDAAALKLLDRVFLDPAYDDPGYRQRRERTTLIGLACDRPGEACFCTAVGGDPHGQQALDLLLTDIGESWLCRPITDKGERLVESLKAADPAAVGKAERQAEAARAKLSFTPDLAALADKLAGAFEHDVWQELSRACVNCGVCTYVCPTCHCFDVTDEEAHGRGERIRTWDSCQFALFTRHASGHNPRPIGRDRLRNRILHKFRYYPRRFCAGNPPEDIGTPHPSSGGNKDSSSFLRASGAASRHPMPVLCVGCGRCITDCPVGIDLREMLETLERTGFTAKDAKRNLKRPGGQFSAYHRDTERTECGPGEKRTEA